MKEVENLIILIMFLVFKKEENTFIKIREPGGNKNSEKLEILYYIINQSLIKQLICCYIYQQEVKILI